MKHVAVFIAAITCFSAPLNAATISDFTGYEIAASVDVIDDGDVGGGAFSASLSGASTAVIGSGSEFSVLLSTPSGFTGGLVNIDIAADGTIEARGAAPGTNTAVGGLAFSPFSFSLSFVFTNPAVEVISYTEAGGLVRGAASVSGFDPVVWTFVSESDNSFGRLMSFSDSNPVPSMTLRSYTPS